MTPSLADAGLLTLSFLIPLLVVVVAMPAYIRYLTRSGRVADDVHKQPVTKVPLPAGPLLLAGALAGEVLVYAAFGSLVPVAVIGAAAIAFAIGLADDLYVLGGKTKPLLLLFAAAPLVLLVMVQTNLYLPALAFPIFGMTSEHFSIYTALAIVSFPVVANAFNMMDSFNGEISWFTLLATSALLFAVVLHASFASGFSLARVAATLPLLAVAAGFLIFNRFPSRVFDGDSGALMFGAMFAALAVTGGVEIAAMVAIVPAILNSFYILSSVRGFVERRTMKSRPTYMGEDGRLYASPEAGAPATLVRMLLLDGPMSERELVKAVAILTGIACVLSGVTSLMTWVL
ncbi:MAG: UDP-N-acetylglucosamine-1-phosphate transferase [Thaumarchaeota archaeon]|nr:UDP-N-acetylglucosamine-1-phosphate transferase [Nitrososphaerota archaeon]